MSPSSCPTQDLHQILVERMSLGARMADPAGLDAMARLDARMGYPGREACVVQIVGTNGKGSTASLLTHLLRRHGLRVGLFSSPHLRRVHERIRIACDLISNDRLYAICDTIASHEAAIGQRLTFFELLTMAALEYFQQEKIKYIVLEAGLGGRLDSTRVRQSQLTLVTPIALDHQAVLGPDIQSIAREKAAVIHANATVYSAIQDPVAKAVLEAQAQRVSTPLEFIPAADSKSIGGLKGYQCQNAALAKRAAQHILARCNKHFNDQDPELWSSWSLPGRLQRQTHPSGGSLLWDVAHNPHGVEKVVSYAQSVGLRFDLVIWFAAIDKDREAIKKLLTTLGCPMQYLDLDAEQATQMLEKSRSQLSQSVAQGQHLLVIGSHRLVGALQAGPSIDGLQDPVERRPFQRPCSEKTDQ